MFDGSTPSSEPAPFAVGYGNGYGYESLPAGHGAAVSAAAVPAAADQTAPAASTADLGATLAVSSLDLERVAADRPRPTVASPAHPPYTARPAGSAHPRRRYGRGLVLGSIALLAITAGIGAVVLTSGPEVAPTSATATLRPPAASGSTAPDAPLVDLPPVSIIEPTSITRVPATPGAPT